MPLTIPPVEESPKSELPKGGSPALDAAYLNWRDALLNEWAERLVARAWHSFDLLDLMPAWKFNDLLIEALAGTTPLFGDSPYAHLNYSHRIRFLAVALHQHPRKVRALALRILESTAGTQPQCR